MQQAEHITESEVDIEKKKQELYSEIDALGIKSDSRINKLKKFLADRKIWHLEEMDYPLRNSYEQYLRGQIRSQIVSFYLKIYDTVKQQHIYQQMQTLNGKRIYEWKYQNKIYFLKYYPEKEIAETFETSYKTNLLVWDFTQNCSEVLKKQIFYTLSRIIANTSMSKAYRNVRLKSLKLLYDSCVQLNITDIGLLEMEQVETILKNFPETSQRSILGECRRDAFMQQEQIQWEANLWYLERLHLGKHRIDESKSLISISFMEVKEIQNREILQAYMKYELGITGQAVSTIVRRFVCIRNFIELLEQEKILAIHATVAEVKKYADGFGDTEYIFVNEKEPDRPMQYMAIKTKVMSMIQEKQLKDDHGELFGFGTHMFRHYYGVKLTEMHLDDWTIARLLGHKRLNNVQHYRKMSNQRMADETREVRQRMSDIIYMSLARWGEEYEQIRQDD